MNCPICDKNLDEGNSPYGHEHVLGKYEVSYCSILTIKTAVYVRRSMISILEFKTLVYLTEERVDKYLLLQ